MNLIKFRKEKGISQAELAKQIGVSKSAVCHWEKNNILPKVNNLKLLSVIFDCTVDDLIREDKPNVK